MKRPTNDSTLSPAQFTEALAEIGWKQIDFARKTGLSAAAVSRWATGQDTVPLWVTAHIDLLRELADLHARFLVPVKPNKPTPAAPDDEVPNQPPTSTNDLDALVAKVNAAAKPPTD
jgi:transcriptional regulator with XRE-family HTH domain